MAGGAHVALLRGINVGGKNILPMSQLQALFTGAGCSEVRTYIQSGNVVFRAPAALARRLPAMITGEIKRRFGLEVPLILRTAAELERVLQGNPFLAAGADPDTLHVMFLAGAPTAAAAASLDPGRSPPDEFQVRGAEIYLRCPGGVGRSRLTNAWFDARLSTVSTLRNWRTVGKLFDLLPGLPPGPPPGS